MINLARLVGSLKQSQSHDSVHKVVTFIGAARASLTGLLCHLDVHLFHDVLDALLCVVLSVQVVPLSFDVFNAGLQVLD